MTAAGPVPRPAGVEAAAAPASRRRAAVEDAAGVLVGREQTLHPLPQGDVAAAGLVQERLPLGRVASPGRRRTAILRSSRGFQITE